MDLIIGMILGALLMWLWVTFFKAETTSKHIYHHHYDEKEKQKINNYDPDYWWNDGENPY